MVLFSGRVLNSTQTDYLAFNLRRELRGEGTITRRRNGLLLCSRMILPSFLDILGWEGWRGNSEIQGQGQVGGAVAGQI